MTEKVKTILRIAAGLIILSTGIITLIYSVDTLVQSLGSALIITGLILASKELILLWLKPTEIIDLLKNVLEEIKKALSKQVICWLSDKHEGHPVYHRWKLETKSQTMWFAGHSVLHSIQRDFKVRQLGSVEECFKKKLSEGSTIKVLFLDVMWDLLDKVAEGEGRTGMAIRIDIATSLGICERICESIWGDKLSGSIEIRRCQELKQYAFQYVNCQERMQSDMLCGFYFANVPGIESPLFAVEGDKVQECFIRHFAKVFEDGKCLLTYSNEGLNKYFDDVYYVKCKESLKSKLDPKVVDELMPDLPKELKFSSA